MSVPLRVKDALYREAKAEGALMNRSAAKQVEFWATLGKKLAHSIRRADMQGIARIHVEISEAAPLDPEQVFATVGSARQAGSLGQKTAQGYLYSEASLVLDRVCWMKSCLMAVVVAGALSMGNLLPNECPPPL
ncbi:MAG: hypothetical protein GXP11_07440 [Gammaproteobacteria bacterium]|nr:hypothetical protein [Gammaproteobacteria bacterium]